MVDRMMIKESAAKKKPPVNTNRGPLGTPAAQMPAG